MSKWRKKPVVIEAWQWLFSDKQEEEPEWITEADDIWPKQNGIKHEIPKKLPPFIRIKTLEGEHIASVGDFIIKGVKGEIYACKPDIFHMTYDPVKETV